MAAKPEIVILDDGRRLKLHRKIGSGAYSTIYKCNITERCGDDPRLYACKRISLFRDTDRCLLEAAIMSSFVHPNIAAAEHAYITKDNELFLLQELALGDLRRASNPDGGRTMPPLDSARLVRLRSWFHDLTLGLQCMHREEIVHGDVKAANALLYEDGRVALSDFSLSLKLWGGEDDGRRRTVISTITHRSPEVHAACARPDAPCWSLPADIWALGCTFYEVLNGETPFLPEEDEDNVWRSMITWASSTNETINPWGKQYCPETLSLVVAPSSVSFGIPVSRVKRVRSLLGRDATRSDIEIAEMMDDLISRCLVVDPSRRITAREALMHPLFVGMSVPQYCFRAMPKHPIPAETWAYIRMSMMSVAGPAVVRELMSQDKETEFPPSVKKATPMERTLFHVAISLIYMSAPLLTTMDTLSLCRGAWSLARRMCLRPRLSGGESEREICKLLSFRLLNSIDSEQRASSPVSVKTLIFGR